MTRSAFRKINWSFLGIRKDLSSAGNPGTSGMSPSSCATSIAIPTRPTTCTTSGSEHAPISLPSRMNSRQECNDPQSTRDGRDLCRETLARLSRPNQEPIRPRAETINRQMNTAFIVDNVHEARAALSYLLTSAGYRTRSYASAEQYLAERDTETPGCLLLNISVPGSTGLDWQRALAGSSPASPVIFLTGNADIQVCVRAMKAGAVDYLTKPVDEPRLFAALDRAFRLDGEERRVRAFHRAIEQRTATLTPRERQVMERVVFGQPNKHIVIDLGVGEKTIRVHRGRVMLKMGARAVPELVQLVARAGVAPDASPHLAARWLQMQNEGQSRAPNPSLFAHARNDKVQ